MVETDGKQNYMEWLETAADFTESKTGKRPEITDQKKDEQRIRFTPAKWDIEEYSRNSPLYSQNYNSTVNWYVLRYADLLLLYAEALNESQGPTETAHAALNLVRRRAFGDQKHDLSTLAGSDCAKPSATSVRMNSLRGTPQVRPDPLGYLLFDHSPNGAGYR